MDKNPSDGTGTEVAEDIEHLYGLQDRSRRSSRALEIAVLTLVDTLADMFPGTREIVIADMREAAETERSFMRYMQSASEDGSPTDKDIEQELATLEDLITKLERPIIKD